MTQRERAEQLKSLMKIATAAEALLQKLPYLGIEHAVGQEVERLTVAIEAYNADFGEVDGG